MTKTLKELELEHPDWCFRCGHREMSAPFHSCYPAHVINILTAAKREDEERIAELVDDRDLCASERNKAVREYAQLRAQLSSEQSAHAALTAERDEMIEALRHQRICGVCAESWLDCEGGIEAQRLLDRAALKGESHD